MSLGLKLFYLRTRVRKLTQAVVAKELGIRQATVSNLEQDACEPGLKLLRTLCEYFDVTPTYLLCDTSYLEPQPSDRWSNRMGLVTTGQYLELEKNALHELPGKSFLVALLPGTPVYDEESARARDANCNEHDLLQAFRLEQSRRKRRQKELEKELEEQRQASLRRRRGMKEHKRRAARERS